MTFDHTVGRIFITGSSGYVGSHLCLRLQLLSLPFIRLPHYLLSPKNAAAFDRFLTQSSPTSNDIVIHLASSGVTGNSTLHDDLQGNVVLTNNLFEAFLNYNVTSFLVTGTAFEYGLTGNLGYPVTTDSPLLPVGNYALSKCTCFHLCRSLASLFDLNLTYVRLFQVYGLDEPSHRLYPSLLKSVLENTDFPMSSGKQIRDFTHLDDVLDYLLSCLSNFRGFQVLNASSGIPTSVLDFASHIVKEKPNRCKLLPGQIISKLPSVHTLYGLPSETYGLPLIAPFYLHSHLQ